MSTGCYRPKAIVESDRVAYQSDSSSIRITLDYNIRITESCLDLFKEDLIMHNGIPQDKVILEIKYLDFIPTYIVDLCSRLDGKESNINKYCLSRHLSYPQIYR